MLNAALVGFVLVNLFSVGTESKSIAELQKAHLIENEKKDQCYNFCQKRFEKKLGKVAPSLLAHCASKCGWLEY